MNHYTLKKGGKAFIVVPDGVLHRANDKRLRDFILKECIVDAIISLPINTFFTTPKKTYILALSKKENEDEVQNDSVFTYLVSEIGETLDNYRFETEDDHLDDSINLFNQFKGSKKHFKSDDLRCKLIDINYFKEASNWMIDKKWTEEERVSLGIASQSNIETLNSFTEIVGDMVSGLSSFSKELKSLEGELESIDKKTKYSQIDLSLLIDFSKKTNSSTFTKRFIEKHKGDIPVYSASKDESLVGYKYVKDNLENIKYFDDCLTWNIDGSIGKAHYRKGRFSLSEKVIPIIVRDEYQNQVDVHYLKMQIEIQAQKEGFNYSNKAGKGKISKLSLKIPVNDEGYFDLQIQKDIVELNKSVMIIKNEMISQLNLLKSTQIDLEL